MHTTQGRGQTQERVDSPILRALRGAQVARVPTSQRRKASWYAERQVEASERCHVSDGTKSAYSEGCCRAGRS